MIKKVNYSEAVEWHCTVLWQTAIFTAALQWKLFVQLIQWLTVFDDIIINSLISDHQCAKQFCVSFCNIKITQFIITINGLIFWFFR